MHKDLTTFLIECLLHFNHQLHSHLGEAPKMFQEIVHPFQEICKEAVMHL